MTMLPDIVYIIVFIAVSSIAAPLLGRYMADVFEGKRNLLTKIVGPLERLLYRICRINPAQEMTWKEYAIAFLLFNGIGLIALFFLQIVQGRLPFNPRALGAVRWDTALNTAISFMTNTDWQAYGGESTMSYFTQMAGITVQNFLSAAAGMGRGIAPHPGLHGEAQGQDR